LFPFLSGQVSFCDNIIKLVRIVQFLDSAVFAFCSAIIVDVL